MSTNAEKSFEVRVLEVYDALVACRLERDLLLAEVEQLRAALERITNAYVPTQDEELALSQITALVAVAREALAVRG